MNNCHQRLLTQLKIRLNKFQIKPLISLIKVKPHSFYNITIPNKIFLKLFLFFLPNTQFFNNLLYNLSIMESNFNSANNSSNKTNKKLSIHLIHFIKILKIIQKLIKELLSIFMKKLFKIISKREIIKKI